MKKALLAGLVMATAVMPSAMANLVKMTDLAPSWEGGPFQANILAADGTTVEQTFQTFCLEKTEYVYLGATFEYTINDGAIAGGLEDPPMDPINYDRISWGTAWLYSQFRTDNTFADTDDKLKSLQTAIWYLEDEITDVGLGSYYYNLALAAANASGNEIALDSGGAFGVKVMNLTEYSDNMVRPENPLRQSMLTVPDAGGTLMLLGLGLASIGFYSRRRN